MIKNVASVILLGAMLLACSYHDQFCRTYGTAGTYNQGGVSGSIAVSFDKATNTMNTALTGGITLNQQFFYYSLDDFIDEANAIGLQLWHTRIQNGVKATNSFDDFRRLRKLTTDTEITTSLTWDEKGRRTSASGVYNAGLDCFAKVGYTYDDAALIYDENITDAVGSCSGNADKTNRYHFDVNFMQILREENLEDGITSSDFYTTYSTFDEVCKEF